MQTPPAPCTLNARHFGHMLRELSTFTMLTPAQQTMLKMLRWCFIREVDQGHVYGTGDIRGYKALAAFLHNAWVMISASQGSNELDGLQRDYERYCSFVFPAPLLPDVRGRQRGHYAVRRECLRQYKRLMPLVLYQNATAATCSALWLTLEHYDEGAFYVGKEQHKRPGARA